MGVVEDTYKEIQKRRGDIVDVKAIVNSDRK